MSESNSDSVSPDLIRAGTKAPTFETVSLQGTSLAVPNPTQKTLLIFLRHLM